jgi:protein-S-isoprenylcysteine O-methyltransferase Ste14
MLWRYLPLAGIIWLIVIGGVIRPLVQMRLHGKSGVFLFRGNAAQTVRDVLFVLMFVAFIAHGISGPRSPAWVGLLVDHEAAPYKILLIAGAVLIVAGIVVSAAAQLNLGASWRIGIDADAAPGIVTGGLYRFSRHPIFLGFLLVFAGYAAMQPTPLSVALLLAAYVGLRIQARAEENYMLRTYGDAYRRYAGRVGRLLPGIGKLRLPAAGAIREEPSLP